MNKLAERIREARNNLHLSQEYVANCLNIKRTAVVEIESGKRKVSAEELGKLSDLFHMTSDELLNGKETNTNVDFFARSFGTLDENDQKEIMNLIEFKRAMKGKK